MANGALRPWVVATAVVALIAAAAYRGQSVDPAADSAADDARAASVTQAATGTEPPTVSHVASTSAPGEGSKVLMTPESPGVVSVPVQEVDDLGTRRLTGHEGRTVALTFDDGPHPRHTAEVLGILRDHEVPAMFCLVGDHAAFHPDLVQAIIAGGHALCNHSRTHDMAMRDRSDSRIEGEITDTDDILKAAVPDTKVTHFRAPGGYFASNVNRVAMAYDLTPIGWSVDTEDWRQPGADVIRARVIERAHPGAIVLMHDGGGDRSGTVEALPGIIVALKAMGYEFVVPVP